MLFSEYYFPGGMPPNSLVRACYALKPAVREAPCDHVCIVYIQHYLSSCFLPWFYILQDPSVPPKFCLNPPLHLPKIFP